MSPRRPPGTSLAALLVAVGLSLLGFRLFLPGAAPSCARAGARCCCDGGAPEPQGAPESKGCGCSISPAAPIPAATLASADVLPQPVAVEGAPALPALGASRPLLRSEGPAPRARSAPTQAFLTTFRN